MGLQADPVKYDAWYQTPRGDWIARQEFKLMMSMMRPAAGESLLDVGCGTGHFSRRFAQTGLQVTGIDPDTAALEFARIKNGRITYSEGDATQLDFPDGCFDYCTAVTSLCFVEDPARALREMWRVSRKGVMLGLLNRDGRLYREREQHPGYAGARWDTVQGVESWLKSLPSRPGSLSYATAIYYPKGNAFSRIMETVISSSSRRGSFLAVYLSR